MSLRNSNIRLYTKLDKAHKKIMERGNQIRNPGGERGDQEGSSQD